MQSCGSIWVVYGLKSRPRRCSTTRAARTLPSRRPDTRRRARCSCRPRRSSCPSSSTARDALALRARRRATTLAISLPSVVGAGGLAVRARRASAARRARAPARAASAIDRVAAPAAARSSRARREHQRVARLLMSSRRAGEVDELARRARSSGVAVDAFLEPVLDRLDVVVGGALDRLDRARRRPRRSSATSSQQARARAAAKRRNFGEAGVATARCSQAISTCTRRCIRPNSLKQRAQRVDLARRSGRRAATGRTAVESGMAPEIVGGRVRPRSLRSGCRRRRAATRTRCR